MPARRSVLEYLETGARLHGGDRIVTDETGSCTYAELRRAARCVGTALLARSGDVRGASPGAAACFGAAQPPLPGVIFMEKNRWALAAFLGTLYAGCFYVPVYRFTPPERAARMAKTLVNPAVVCDGASAAAGERAFPGCALLRVEELLACPEDGGLLDEAASSAVDSDPVYVLFTSGSTGEPKGVTVSHRAVAEFVDGFVETFGIRRDDVIGNQAPFDFDVSVKDIYGSLATGAELCIIPRRLFSQPAALVDCINGNRVTVMVWAVAALCLISSLHGLEYASMPSVRLVMFSGEVMPTAHLKRWMQALPDASFVNLYGPTECTCNCLFHPIDRSRGYEGGIPLGTPLPNRRVLLLDGDGAPVRNDGEEGELYVGGSTIALGYYANPERTAAAFMQNPLVGAYPETVYRTGDLAYRLNGELYFCGRADNQIKHQGHRIELEEIDAALEREPGVLRCRCAYDARRKRIHAFVEGDADLDALRQAIRSYLPVPMLPQTINRVEQMPLTKNGKVDRKALLASVTKGAS